MNTVLSLYNVSKIYPGTQALSEASFCVQKGEVHGFLGPNGAGKTTTFNLISGYLRPSSGNIEILGKDLKSYGKELYHNIGILPEIPPLYPHMVVRDYLNFVASIRGLNTKLRKQRLSYVLEKCGLGDVSHRLIKNLSKGYKQRVGMAQALVHNPEFLILDEPTAGLDPIAIMEVRKLIQELKKDHTILFSSHQLHEVEQICSHITIIQKGRIVSSETLEKTKRIKSVGHNLKVELAHWEDHYLNSLKSILGSCEILCEQKQGSTFLNIISDRDCRSLVSNFVITHNLGLLGLSEDTPNLEDVFGKMAQNENGFQEQSI
ncbi:MAG: ABC transporter ATP-binding protein [Bacteriovoracaceae bacterium]